MKDMGPFLHKLFRTGKRRRSITEIKPHEFVSRGIKVVALDADNTSSYDRTTDPLPGANEWIQSLKSEGLKVVLLSNAKTERARILADKYGIPVVGLACKPLPFGYLRCILRFFTRPSRICMVGDQLFTDILGANFMGFQSIYVYPHEKEKQNVVSFRIRRAAEKIIFAYQDRKYKDED